MRKTWIACVVLLAAVAALVLTALRLPSRQIAVAAPPPRAIEAEVVAQHLAAAIRFPTISFSSDPAQLQTAAGRCAARTCPPGHAFA